VHFDKGREMRGVAKVVSESAFGEAGARGGLDGYALLPAVRADLLRRLGRHEAARQAYLEASAATELAPLRRLYARRMAELSEGGRSTG